MKLPGIPNSKDTALLMKLFFRLQIIQVLLIVISSLNGMISGLFASNFVGSSAMSAMGLYSPINMLFTSVNTVFIGGSLILCGKYLGRNQTERIQNVFS